MPTASPDPKKDALVTLRDRIRSHEDWWFFPDQDPVQGFMGTGDVFLVGDQPSTAAWGPGNRNRQLFYNTLEEVGLANAHLTDLYKKRGLSSQLAEGLPDDFTDHVSFLREEIAALKPKTIVALGELAQRLLIQNLPDWNTLIPRIWHFSHVVNERLEAQYAAHIRERIWGT